MRQDAWICRMRTFAWRTPPVARLTIAREGLTAALACRMSSTTWRTITTALRHPGSIRLDPSRALCHLVPPVALSKEEPQCALVTRAGLALGKSQEQIGELIGVSRRTISRWMHTSGTVLAPGQAATLARALYPVDPALAARVAASSGQTLESLGTVTQLASEVPRLVVKEAIDPARLVEVIVCAAAEALDASPRVVRPALLAAFASAREVGLTVEAVESALRARSAPRTPGKKKA